MSDRRASLLSGLALAAALGACGEGPPALFEGATSSSIVLDEGDAVVQVDAATLEVTRRFEVTGGPEQVILRGGALAVSLGRDAAVAWIDLASGAVERVPVPCGGTAGLAADDRAVFVACPMDDRVVELAPGGPALAAWRVPGGPAALAAVGGGLVVTLARAGQLARFERAALRAAGGDLGRPPEAPVARALHLSPRAGFAATDARALAVDPATGGLAGVYQVVDHDSDRARPPEQGGYGAVFDAQPRIEPRVWAACGGRYARFDGGLRVMSGPSAVAAASGWLWVAHRQTDNVLAVACDALEDAEALGAPVQAELTLHAAFTVGRGPRGLALSADGRTAWVDVGFDHAVARLLLPAGPSSSPSRAQAALLRPVGASVYSDAGQRGRKLFFDAVNTHLTPSGVVTCGTCHPDGGDDGLSWFLHTVEVPRKLRRTPPAWGARPGLGPLHWDGGFADAAVLTQATVRALMEGDGLLVDADAVAAYMAERPLPTPRPVPEILQSDLQRGAGVFAAAGCAECHLGPLFADGLRHALFVDGEDPDGLMPEVRTPTLIGARGRPPYLHDGRARTLEDVLVTHNRADRHGRTAGLSAPDLAALVTYLESL